MNWNFLGKLGSKAEQEVASHTENDIAAKLAKQQDLEHALSDIPAVNKDAADSAKVFTDNGPNFDTVGDAESRVAPGTQNFTMEGKPYGKNFPVKSGETPKNLPRVRQPDAIIDPTKPVSGTGPMNDAAFEQATGSTPAAAAGNLPALKNNLPTESNSAPQMRDVGSNVDQELPALTGKTTAPTAPGDVADPGSSLWKYLPHEIAAAGLGAAGLYALSGGDDQKLMAGEPGLLVNNQLPKSTPLQAQTAQTPVKAQAKATPKAPATPGQASTDKDDPGLNLDFGNGGANELAQIKDAQNRQNMAVLTNQLGKAADLIGSSIGRSDKTHQEGFDSNIKDAGTIVDQNKALMEAQKDDPNSPMAKGMKSFLQGMGYEVKGNPSASDMTKMFPIAEKYMQHVDDQQTKRDLASQHSDDMKYKYAQLGVQKQYLNQAKADKDEAKAATEFGNKMEGGRGTNPAVNKAFDAIRNANTALEIVNNPQWKNDLNNMPPDMVATLRAELAKMATGGAATEGGRHELNTETYASNLAAFFQKAKNQPTGAQLGDFLKNNLQYVQGIKQVNQDRVNEYRANTYNAYNKRAPGATQNYVSEHPELQDWMDRHHQTVQAIKDKMGSGMSYQDAFNSVSNPGANKAAGGNKIHIISSDGQQLYIPEANLKAAQAKDPGLQVVNGK